MMMVMMIYLCKQAEMMMMMMMMIMMTYLCKQAEMMMMMMMIMMTYLCKQAEMMMMMMIMMEMEMMMSPLPIAFSPCIPFLQTPADTRSAR